MTKPQILTVVTAIGLFFILYLGCEVRSKGQKNAEHRQAATASTTIASADLLKDAVEQLAPDARLKIQTLVESADKSNNDPKAKAAALKTVSAAWHDEKREDIAAFYAEQVAEAEATDAAWSIAGANYFLALRQSQDQTIRDFCTQHAVLAFQNAASLNPQQLEHRINLALCYTENPSKDNPMQGILLLRELDTQNPDNVAVNYQLARLAVRTQQWERAKPRLEKILAKEPKNQKAICLAAEVFANLNDPRAAAMQQQCKQ
jgi:hypothetical protein